MGLCVRTLACEDSQLHPTVIWLEVFSMMTINVACIGRCLCSIGGWMAYTCANVLVSEVSTHYIICMLLTYNFASTGRCLNAMGGMMAYTCANVLVSEVPTKRPQLLY